MRRYWISPDAVRGNQVMLTGDVLHHIRDVCRQKLGSRFEVIVSGGSAHLVEIVEEKKNESLARILETRKIAPLPAPHLHLAISIPRFPVLEAVLEKAVELGVHSVHPFFSEFSFIRTRSDIFDKKQARFQKIIESATQQCGRGELMSFSQPVAMEILIKDPPFNRNGAAQGLFAYEGEAVLTAKQAVDAIHTAQPSEVWVFVGSEGGFSEKEVELFKSLGLKPVTLGPQVLRVETACVATVSIIKYGLDLMQ